MPTAEVIQARIQVAKRIKQTRDADYDDHLKLLTNEWTDGKMKLAPNTVHSAVRQLVSTVLFDDPEYFHRAMRPEFADEARGITAYSNWLWSQIEGSEQTELVITDAIVHPIGFWKIGMGRAYNSERQLRELEEAEAKALAEQDAWLNGIIDTPVDDDDRHATHIPIHQSFLASLQDHPDSDLLREVVNDHIDRHGEGLVVTEPTRSATQEGEEPDMPFIYRVSPRNIFVEAGCMVFEQSRYVLERARMLYDEWKDNPAYNHQDIQPTDVTDEAKTTFEAQEMEMTKTERGMGVVDIWHHIDKASGEYSSWVEGHMVPVRPPRPQFYRFMKGYPYEALRFEIIPERLHGPGLIERLEHPQRFEIDLMHRLGTHARNASTKWVLVTDRLQNPENVSETKGSIQDSEMDAVVEANDERVLTAVPPAPLDPIFGVMRGSVNEAMQEAIGLTDTTRGNVTGATATEVRQATAGEGVSLNNMSKKVRKALININKKLLAITREYGPDHMVVPVFGDRTQWADFTRASLAGDYQTMVQLPLPGDKQNDLNNIINAVHEMAASPHIRGEGEKRLHLDMLKKMGLQPELYDLDPDGDTRGRVALEHQLVTLGQPVPPPLEDEDTSYHIEQHNMFASQIERDLMQIQQIAGQVNQIVQQQQAQGIAPQVPPEAQIAMQQAQGLQMQLQNIMQHIQMTEQIRPSIPQGRRRNALLFPVGETLGTPESIQSNEIAGA